MVSALWVSVLVAIAVEEGKEQYWPPGKATLELTDIFR